MATRSGKTSRRSVACAVVAGVLLGTLLAWSPGAGFVLALAALTALWLRASTPHPDRRFLVWLFITGFVIRVVASVGLDAAAWLAVGGRPFQLQYTPTGAIIAMDQTRRFIGAGDSDNYSARAYSLARFARGDRGDEAVRAMYHHYAHHAYLYVTAWFYYLFGFSPVAVKWLTCYLGAWLGPALYSLAKACFNRTVARWSGLAAILTPSLILWSATNLKDAPLILLGVLILWGFAALEWHRLPTAWGLVTAAGLVVALLVHGTIRAEVYAYVVPVCFAVAIWWTTRVRWGWKVAVLLLLAAAVLAARDVVWAGIRSGLVQALDVHTGHVGYVGSSYRFLPDAFYESATAGDWTALVQPTSAFFLMLANGVRHYVFQPFPWTVSTLFQLLAYPQMVLWYGLLACALPGIAAILADPRRQTVFLVLVLGAWVGVGALTNGNAGTAFRMRDMVTPLVLMLGCHRIWRIGLRWR